MVNIMKNSIILWCIEVVALIVTILFNCVIGFLIYVVAFTKALNIVLEKYRQQENSIVDFIKQSQGRDEDFYTVGIPVTIVLSSVCMVCLCLTYWFTRDCQVMSDWLLRL